MYTYNKRYNILENKHSNQTFTNGWIFHLRLNLTRLQFNIYFLLTPRPNISQFLNHHNIFQHFNNSYGFGDMFDQDKLIFFLNIPDFKILINLFHNDLLHILSEPFERRLYALLTRKSLRLIIIDASFEILIYVMMAALQTNVSIFLISVHLVVFSIKHATC